MAELKKLTPAPVPPAKVLPPTACCRNET